MPKKKSIKKAAQTFCQSADKIAEFVSTVSKGQKDSHVSRIYDAAIISLYREFEELILEVLVGAINNDTEIAGKALGVDLPKHLTDQVCRYLITGPSYFDFKGRSGLIKRTKQYVPAEHFLVEILKKPAYREVLEQLCTLRNYAAHGSPQSKRAAMDAVGQTKMGSAGSWLKSGTRFRKASKLLSKLADEIEAQAPY